VVAVVQRRRGPHDDLGLDLLAHSKNPSHE
jgi:hypothetical protein